MPANGGTGDGDVVAARLNDVPAYINAGIPLDVIKYSAAWLPISHGVMGAIAAPDADSYQFINPTGKALKLKHVSAYIGTGAAGNTITFNLETDDIVPGVPSTDMLTADIQMGNAGGGAALAPGTAHKISTITHDNVGDLKQVRVNIKAAGGAGVVDFWIVMYFLAYHMQYA